MTRNRLELFRLWLDNHPEERRRAGSLTLAELHALVRAAGLTLTEDELRAGMAEPGAGGRPGRRRTWRWMALAVAVLLAVLLTWDQAESVRRNQDNLNPEAVAAMAGIQAGLLVTGRADLARECAEVGPGMGCRAFGEEIACVLERRYALLRSRGFELPPLYRPGYAPRVPLWEWLVGLDGGS